jgi:hypothetical protein
MPSGQPPAPRSARYDGPERFDSFRCSFVLGSITAFSWGRRRLRPTSATLPGRIASSLGKLAAAGLLRVSEGNWVAVHVTALGRVFAAEVRRGHGDWPVGRPSRRAAWLQG